MKKIILSSFLTLMFCFNLIGQSVFRENFRSVGPVVENHEAYIQIQSNSTGLRNTAEAAKLFNGDPSAATVKDRIFFTLGVNSYGRYDIGKFYVTPASSIDLEFRLEYGYASLRDDKRFTFDKVTVSVGKYKEAETAEYQLPVFAETSKYCNIFPDFSGNYNCGYHQNRGFSLSRNVPVPGYRAYNNVSFIIIRYYKYQQVVKTAIIPYVVLGKTEQYISSGPGPLELLNIIRAVPGDQSIAKMIASTSTSSEVTIGAQKSDSQTNSLSASVKAGFSVGPVGGSVTAEANMSVTNTAVEGKENTYVQKFVATTTHENNNSKGDRTDLFIVAQRNYDFAMEYTIKAQTSNGLDYISKDQKMLFYPLKVIATHVFSEKQLMNEVVPDLLRNNEKGKADYWKLLLHKNDSIKTAVKKTQPDETINISGNGVTTYETEYSRSSSLTLSQEISIENTESISVQVEGSNASVTGEKTWVVSTTSSSSNTNGNADKFKTQYIIEDNDYQETSGRGGDRLYLKLWKDPATGTAVWELDENNSITSCPYEGGYQSDQPEITVTDPVTQNQVKTAAHLNVPVSGEKTFEILLRNKSTKSRAYDIRIPNTTSKPIIESADDLGAPFIIDAGETATIRLTVKNKESTPKEYRNFEVIFGPECDPSVCDTVLLSASFVSDDILSKEKDCISANGFYDNFNETTTPTDGVLEMTYFVNEYGDNSYTRSGTGDLEITVEKQNDYMGCSFSDIEKKVFVDVSSSNLVHVALTNKGGRDIDVDFAFISGDIDQTKVKASSNGEIFGGEIAAGATMIKTFDLKDATRFIYLPESQTCPSGLIRKGPICYEKSPLFDPTELSEIVWKFNLRYYEGFGTTGYNYPVNFHYITAGDDCQMTAGSQETGIISSFTVYPNPATNVLNVSYEGNSTCNVSLIDLNGREIFSSQISKNNHSIAFNTSNLNAGIYFVSLNDGENLEVQKVVIK